MSNADNIENSGSCHIWWDKSSTGSATCGFKKGSSGSLVAYFGSNGDFTSLNDITGSNLETSNGWIIGNNAPLWITESSSSGDLVSFRKGGNEKVLIKGDGEVVLSDSATISSSEVIKVESSSTSELVKFRNNSSDKISITANGELVFFDSCTLRASTSTPAGTAITIEGRGSSDPILLFRDVSSSRVLSVENDGELLFEQKTLISQKNVGSLFEYFSADNEIVIGFGNGTTQPDKVLIGDGRGTFASKSGVLGIFPEDNGGAVSFNKGDLDIYVDGYAGASGGTKELDWGLRFFSGVAGSNYIFRMYSAGVLEWGRILSSTPSLYSMNDGQMWLEEAGTDLYLKVFFNGGVKSVKFS